MSDREPKINAGGGQRGSGTPPPAAADELPPDDEKKLTTSNGGVPAVADPTAFAPEEAGAGFEGTRLEEQTVPFLRMAQGLSPELNPGKGEHIPGLALGMMFNTATREFYPGQPPGVEFIACRKEYGYGQWIPRDLGSGFRGMVSPDDSLVRETMSRMTAKYGSSARFKFPRYKDGRWSDEPPQTRDTQEAIELVETGQIYALYGPTPLTFENAKRAVIAFTSTALGAYTGYNDKHLAQRWPQRGGPPAIAPIYAYRWRLTTFLDKRGNNEFYNWRVDLAKQGDYLGSLYAGANPELFAMAKEFFSQIAAGTVRADDTAGQGAPAERQPGDDSDDVPF
jgi:hypothetical protein